MKDAIYTIINKCIILKTQIFEQEFNNNTIKNLFFSNIYNENESTYINIKSSQEFYKTNNEIEIIVLGVWFFKDMYGITYEINND